MELDDFGTRLAKTLDDGIISHEMFGELADRGFAGEPALCAFCASLDNQELANEIAMRAGWLTVPHHGNELGKRIRKTTGRNLLAMVEELIRRASV